MDDGTYTMIHTYTPQFSGNVGIQVGQVFLETCVHSGKKKARVYKLPCMKVLKEIIVLSHKQVLLPPWIEYWERGLNLQVPPPGKDSNQRREPSPEESAWDSKSLEYMNLEPEQALEMANFQPPVRIVEMIELKEAALKDESLE